MVNKLTYYLGTQVVQQESQKLQAKVILQIIKIGKVRSPVHRFVICL